MPKKKKGKAKNPRPQNTKSHPKRSQTMTSQSVMSKVCEPKTTFTAKIEMLSDWHIGSGAGIPGNIDRLIQRDNDGLPYVPAKTLTGIWRDACELLAMGLDNGIDGHWMQWVQYLFGDEPALEEGATTKPREAALSVRPAYLPEELRQLLKVKSEDLSKAKITPEQKEIIKGKLTLKDALTFTKPGISIDPDSGCAIRDFLRFEEMARGGCTLTASCELLLPEEDRDKCCAAYALLVAGAKLVERLGGKRRRGAGKCCLEIEVNRQTEPLEPYLNWLEKHPEAPELPAISELNNTELVEEQYTGEGWSQVTLNINTLSPVIIPKRTVGNVTESLDYIPGTYLLPLISRKLGKLGVNLGNAISHGNLIVTNATIAIDDHQPGCPVPFALFAKKMGGSLQEGHVYNRLQEAEPSDQLKQIRQGYIHPICQDGSLPKSDQVMLTLETHNTVKDDVQRPSGAGGVYSYEAITTGTGLKAYLRLRQGLVEDLRNKDSNWWQRFNGKRDRLGQSKKDDFGLVEIKASDLKPLPTELEIQSNSESELTELTVWLLSDVLLRDERLRPTTSVEKFGKQLGNMLGVLLELKEPDDKTLSVLTRQNRRESWQVRWCLPRPSLVGLAAGSCMVFTFKGHIDPTKLAKVLASGIGERRAEGYGQLSFNNPLLTQATSHLKGCKKQNEFQGINMTLLKKGDPGFEYAQLLEKTAWRHEIQRCALKVASQQGSRRNVIGTTGTSPSDKPSMSQLGGLRSLVLKLNSPEDQAIKGWFGDAHDNDFKDKWDKRQEKWRGNLQYPYQLLADPSRKKVWELLEIDTEHLKLTEPNNLKHELWAEAVQTLVAACIRAHKRESDNLPSNGGQEHGA